MLRECSSARGIPLRRSLITADSIISPISTAFSRRKKPVRPRSSGKISHREQGCLVRSGSRGGLMRRSGRYEVQIGNGLIRERHFTPFFANDTGIKRYLPVEEEAEEQACP